ncbi:MAG: hypothetical protein KF915_16950 [Polyangiaceae bacterium]|nr:hypothetical protein [Polyangiaceae bacterium]
MKKTHWSLVLALGVMSPGLVSCGPPCPTASVQSEREWERALDQMKILPLDAKGAITIKRDVHSVVVDAGPREFAHAFQAVMMDTSRHFGLIQVRRKASNEGRPFQVGERFQGHYSIELASEQWGPFWQKVFNDLYEHAWVRRVTCAIENGATSDYGVISLIELDPPPGSPFRMRYDYLGGDRGGSPIAGSSTFTIESVVDVHELQRYGVSQAARITQVFEYQEQSEPFAFFFSVGGLKLHNQVVFSQARQAAELIGAKILESDIPKAYQEGI